VNEPELRAKLAAGVETADGTYEAALLGLESPSTVCVGVAEGKHRMVRRMLANAGGFGMCVYLID
jgi:16S rRNA U516 pseudouridylate synthase RsuA-like enzyme